VTDAEFPVSRFVDAGASTAEVEQLVGEFSRSDISVQSALVATWRSQSSGDLRAELDLMREDGHFAQDGADDAPGTDGQQAGSGAAGKPQGASSSSTTGETDPEDSTDAKG
jgi:hypothetical protein